MFFSIYSKIVITDVEKLWKRGHSSKMRPLKVHIILTFRRGLVHMDMSSKVGYRRRQKRHITIRNVSFISGKSDRVNNIEE